MLHQILLDPTPLRRALKTAWHVVITGEHCEGLLTVRVALFSWVRAEKRETQLWRRRKGHR